MIPSTNTLRVLSLGYENFMADMIWVRLLQFHQTGQNRSHLPHYIDAVIELDPEFKAAYRWGATAMLFSGGRTSRENVLASNRYLLAGMEQFPDDYYYPYTLGLNWAFYYPARNEKEERAKIRRAVEYLHIAMQKPDVPRGTALLIAGLLRYQEDPGTIIDFLEQAYATEPDPEVRRKIEGRLNRMIGANRRRLFESQRLRRERWLEQNGFDYLPPGLAFHVGHRRTFDPTSPPQPHDAPTGP